MLNKSITDLSAEIFRTRLLKYIQDLDSAPARTSDSLFFEINTARAFGNQLLKYPYHNRTNAKSLRTRNQRKSSCFVMFFVV